MKIEVRELLNEDEMLSHIFLECINRDDLELIRDEFIGDKDWEQESVKIPVEMKIGGIEVNPKEFFDNWKEQMVELIKKKATELLSMKLGSDKLRDFQYKLSSMEDIIIEWEKDITWHTENPFK